MDARTFFDKVALMRKYQRDYFKYRRKSDLQQSKRLESEIDAEIDRVHAQIGTPTALKPQPGLFDAPEQ
jgi:hypothetical protein